MADEKSRADSVLKWLQIAVMFLQFTAIPWATYVTLQIADMKAKLAVMEARQEIYVETMKDFKSWFTELLKERQAR